MSNSIQAIRGMNDILPDEAARAEILRIHLARRKLVTDHGELAYDYAVVATGATHAYFGHDEWEVLAPGLKSLEDALEIRRRVLLASSCMNGANSFSSCSGAMPTP